ncbi:MAG: hypothetical protein ACPLSO_06295 [Fervidicoccaceae archaeon]
MVNRWGIGSSEKMYSIAEKIAKKHNAVIKAKIPYSRDLVEAYVRGIPIVEFYPDHEISKIFRSIAKEILDVV